VRNMLIYPLVFSQLCCWWRINDASWPSWRPWKTSPVICHLLINSFMLWSLIL